MLSIARIETQIKELVESDEELARLYRVVSSVAGIGKLTALELILVTEEFSDNRSAKACACYGGVAPFEQLSGISIRARSRVSSLANKGLKKLLHMSALSSLRCKGELGAYYDRKVQEGKPKLLVLNALRNKLLHRVYACVGDMRCYSASYKVAC